MAGEELELAQKIDWSGRGRYVHAYGAALALGAAVGRGAGYRARGQGHHQTVFEALELVWPEARDRARFFDRCRRKRNRLTYDRPEEVTPEETKELLGDVEGFRDEVLAWMKIHRADALPPPPSPPPPVTPPPTSSP